MQNARMPRDYLKKIEHAAFPMQVEDAYEIRCLYVLQAANLVDVDIVSTRAVGWATERATVRGITPMGRAELARIGSDGAGHDPTQ